MKNVRNAILVAILTAPIVSCGGGGGSDSSTPPANDVNSNVPNVKPADDFPTVADDEVNALIGRVLLGYSFTGSGSFFVLDSTFATSGISLMDDGTPMLTSTATPAWRLTSGSEFIIGAPVSLVCSYPDNVSRYLCISDVGGEAQTFFMFAKLVGGQASGDFEFCNGRTSAACSNELVVSPDGIVVVEVNPSALASLKKAVEDNGDVLPYLQYEEQGSANVDSGAEPNESQRIAAEAVTEGLANLRDALVK